MIVPLLFLVHSWYPEECCTNKDCYPVEWIKESSEGTTVKTEDGIQVTVPKSIHRLPSRDGDYHLCFPKNDLRVWGVTTIFCFFIPGSA